MPFTNEIAAGNGAIVRNWLQSENFVTGVSGWRISKNGNAEFSNGTFRGSIESGPLSGQHFVVNNVSTGDVVDIYDSSNRLIFSIDQNGVLTSYTYAGGPSAGHLQIDGADITFNNNSGYISPDPPSISAPDITSGGNDLQFYSGTANGNINNASVMQLFGGTSTSGAEIRATARGITGDVLQLDSSNNNNQLVHVGTYNISTDAGGTGVFNHGASFTPVQGFMVGVNGIAANFFYQYAWFPSPFTSSTAKAAFKDQAGNALANTTLGAFGIFFG
jgi:hypothetical protein